MKPVLSEGNFLKKDINIFDFFDYREYLTEYFRSAKRGNTRFSHRSFLASAGIPGTIYLYRVMNYQRKLGSSYIPNFISALKLGKRESNYFKAMVEFGNGKTSAIKEKALREMISMRNLSEPHKLADAKLRFFSRWYYPVIRELAVIVDFKEDYQVLANRVIPRITAVQARGAIKYLVENDFIKKGFNGKYEQNAALISSGDEVNSTILRKYHRTTLSQCINSLDTIPTKNRDISSLTLSVSDENYTLIKREIQQFRKRILALASSEEASADKVCLLGIQLIPRSKMPSSRKRGGS